MRFAIVSRDSAPSSLLECKIIDEILARLNWNTHLCRIASHRVSRRMFSSDSMDTDILLLINCRESHVHARAYHRSVSLNLQHR